MSQTEHVLDRDEETVRQFLNVWSERDIDKIMSYFADDAVYHNVPVAPIRGLDGIRAIFDSLIAAFAEIDLSIVNLAGRRGLVFAERIDYFTMQDGRKVELPVNGVFELQDGKITRFSDYFDLASFESQSGLKL